MTENTIRPLTVHVGMETRAAILETSADGLRYTIRVFHGNTEQLAVTCKVSDLQVPRERAQSGPRASSAEVSAAALKIETFLKGCPDKRLGSTALGEMCGIPKKQAQGAVALLVSTGRIAWDGNKRARVYFAGPQAEIPSTSPDTTPDESPPPRPAPRPRGRGRGKKEDDKT